MRPVRTLTSLAIAVLATSVLSYACGDDGQTVTIGANKDNTLFADPEEQLSSGVGPGTFVGNTGSGLARRALIAFDVATQVPAGATVTQVILSLHLSRTQAGPQEIRLHTLGVDWGEGTSSAQGGSGAPATQGDATWLHRYFDTELWSRPGGDFSESVSAVTSVDGEGRYTWSSVEMVAEVQRWLGNPGENFGWIILGNETAKGTTKRFDTRESPEVANRPWLRIVFIENDSD